MATQKPISNVTGDPLFAYESIGTKMEKTLHRAIKYYLCPDETFHEIKIGRFIADICREGVVTEIQTGSFGSLKSKLLHFLPTHHVTIVYPVVRKKTIHTIDELGILSAPRKSPKIGSLLQIGKELVQIKEFLLHPHLDFLLFLVDADEYRTKTLVPTWHKSFKKIDMYPKGEPVLTPLKTVADYRMLIPAKLDPIFTAKAFQTAAKVGKSHGEGALRMFRELGLIVQIGKQGRAFLYQIANSIETK
jgi:hypothetical protein